MEIILVWILVSIFLAFILAGIFYDDEDWNNFGIIYGHKYRRLFVIDIGIIFNL